MTVVATNCSSFFCAAPDATARARAIDALVDRHRYVRGVERNAGIENDDLAGRALDVGQRLQQHCLGFHCVSDFESAVGDHSEPEVLGMDLVLAYLPVLQLSDKRRSAKRHFVHAVLPVDNHHVPAVEALQHAHQDPDEVRMKHTEELVGCASGIGQRPEDVEDGPYTELLAYRCGMLHGAVMVRREHEADARLGDAVRHLRRLERDLRA